MQQPETAVARCKHGVLRYLPGDAYVGRSLELYGEFSDMEAGLLEKFAGPGCTVVEVGANIGAHTVYLSQLVGPTGRVIAIEAQRAVHAILLDNLQANGCTNVQAICAAADWKNGVSKIPRVDYAAGGNFGAISVGAGEDSVPAMTLDSLDLQECHLLKIDVEGMEHDVIEGALHTIARCQPILYVENDRAEKSAALIAQILALGYRLWWHLPPLYSPRNHRGNREDVFPGVVSVNMLCVPKARAGRLLLREITSPADRWQTAAAPIVKEHRKPDPGEKTCAVVRLGAYGDALWASSVFPHLKKAGYHLTVYTESHGEEALRHDPHLDAIIVQDHLPDWGLIKFWDAEAKKYDRFINLTEAVEKNMLAIREDLRFYWPHAARREVFGGNYLERVHQLAGVPGFEQADFCQRFYPNPAEKAWADAERAKIRGKLVVLAAAGSSPTKFWPHIDKLAQQLARAGVHVVILGDPDGLLVTPHALVRVVGLQWSLRQALAFAQTADAVVGQETGILNAVAIEKMRKVVLLTHSTPANLTAHWVNTIALNGDAPCWPCHRIHHDWTHCTRVEGAAHALCQTMISADRVYNALTSALWPAVPLPVRQDARRAAPKRKAGARKTTKRSR